MNCQVCGKPEKGNPKHPPDVTAITCSRCIQKALAEKEKEE